MSNKKRSTTTFKGIRNETLWLMWHSVHYTFCFFRDMPRSEWPDYFNSVRRVLSMMLEVRRHFLEEQ